MVIGSACCAAAVAIAVLLLFHGARKVNQPYRSKQFGKNRNNVNWRRDGGMR